MFASPEATGKAEHLYSAQFAPESRATADDRGGMRNESYCMPVPTPNLADNLTFSQMILREINCCQTFGPSNKRSVEHVCNFGHRATSCALFKTRQTFARYGTLSYLFLTADAQETWRGGLHACFEIVVFS